MSRPAARRTLFWATLVLLLAAALRLVWLADVPFGWHPDEATKALLARDVLAGKATPVFFSAFTGREALYVYLEAGLFALLGERILAARLLSAWVGLLTVALTYQVGRLLVNRRVGLLAALLLAASLWHLIASRNGYRAVIQPLVQLLALWYLLRGLRVGGNMRDFVLAGLWLGLTQYTYTAVRLFPFLIVVLVLILLVMERQRVRTNWRGLGATAVVAGLVFLPLGLYFWQNPDAFFGRAAQISVFSPEWAGGSPAARLWQSVKETARMFTVWGDINYRFNISGQPVFGPVDGALFYIGLLVSLGLIFWRKGWQRATAVFLWAWLLLMLVPMFLSAESLPYYQRAIGTLPVVYIFPALALDAGLRWLRPRLPDGARRLALTVLLLGLGGWLGVRTAQAYFGDWHLAERNDDDRRVAMVYVADYLRANPPADALYLSTQYMQHPTLSLLAPQHYSGIHWFDARQSLPLPPAAEPATYLFLRENAPQPALLASVDGLILQETAVDRFNRPVFDVYAWQPGERPWPQQQGPVGLSGAITFPNDGLPPDFAPLRMPVDFGHVLNYIGHDRNASQLAPGEPLTLILYWDLVARPERTYIFFVHLLNAAGEVVAGFDANDYPAPFWREDGGERLLSYHLLATPPDLAPGTYQLEIGVYNQLSGERMSVFAGDTAVADRLLLEPVEVVVP